MPGPLTRDPAYENRLTRNPAWEVPLTRDPAYEKHSHHTCAGDAAAASLSSTK